MILKPCPFCDRPDAGCGCAPVLISACRGCGEVTFYGAEDTCWSCNPDENLVPLTFDDD